MAMPDNKAYLSDEDEEEAKKLQGQTVVSGVNVPGPATPASVSGVGATGTSSPTSLDTSVKSRPLALGNLYAKLREANIGNPAFEQALTQQQEKTGAEFTQELGEQEAELSRAVRQGTGPQSSREFFGEAIDDTAYRTLEGAQDPGRVLSGFGATTEGGRGRLNRALARARLTAGQPAFESRIQAALAQARARGDNTIKAAQVARQLQQKARDRAFKQPTRLPPPAPAPAPAPVAAPARPPAPAPAPEASKTIPKWIIQDLKSGQNRTKALRALKQLLGRPQ